MVRQQQAHVDAIKPTHPGPVQSKILFRKNSRDGCFEFVDVPLVKNEIVAIHGSSYIRLESRISFSRLINVKAAAGSGGSMEHGAEGESQLHRS